VEMYVMEFYDVDVEGRVRFLRLQR
jgi:hypothetical protein